MGRRYHALYAQPGWRVHGVDLEIPIRPGVSSIGYVAPGSKVKIQRAHGLTNAGLLSEQMQKFARLSSLVNDGPPEGITVTSYLVELIGESAGRTGSSSEKPLPSLIRSPATELRQRSDTPRKPAHLYADINKEKVFRPWRDFPITCVCSESVVSSIA